MKKLALDLDQLAVESFETHAPAGRRGTVLGNFITDPQTTAMIDVGTTACPAPSGDVGGGDTCDRRCEPSIVNCTTGGQLIVG
jgi:hypothetical protein